MLNLTVGTKNIQVNSDSIKLSDLAEMLEDEYRGHICIAKIDNGLYNLNHIVYKDSVIEFLDSQTEDGNRIYFRGLSFLLVMACRDLFPESKVYIKHSMSNGLYCQVKKSGELTNQDIESIKSKMKDYVDRNLEIKCHYLPNNEAIEDRKSTRLNSSHANISYAVFCLKKKKHRT